MFKYRKQSKYTRMEINRIIISVISDRTCQITSDNVPDKLWIFKGNCFHCLL